MRDAAHRPPIIQSGGILRTDMSIKVMHVVARPPESSINQMQAVVNQIQAAVNQIGEDQSVSVLIGNLTQYLWRLPCSLN